MKEEKGARERQRFDDSYDLSSWSDISGIATMMEDMGKPGAKQA